MSSRSGRCNSNERGSSYDRRARRAWLLSTRAPFGGNGEKVPCWECGAMVNAKTMIVDRITPGEAGGTYRRTNIRPHCCGCSGRQGVRRTMEIRRANALYADDDLCKGCGSHYAADHQESCAVMAAIPEDWR